MKDYLVTFKHNGAVVRSFAVNVAHRHMAIDAACEQHNAAIRAGLDTVFSHDTCAVKEVEPAPVPATFAPSSAASFLPCPGGAESAKVEAIAQADAHLNNAGLSTYSELVAKLADIERAAQANDGDALANAINS